MNIDNNWNDDDFFSQLAIEEVPPVPNEIESQVHRRVNAVLLMTHIFEFAFNALPQAFYTFGECVIHFLLLTLSGKTSDDKDSQRKQL